MITVDVEKSLSHVTLRIADIGPGIHEAELAALESGQETDLVHACGVGLWLVKWLCRFYDGEVSLVTDPREGTVVTIVFQPGSPLNRLAKRARNGGQAEAAA